MLFVLLLYDDFAVLSPYDACSCAYFDGETHLHGFEIFDCAEARLLFFSYFLVFIFEFLALEDFFHALYFFALREEVGHCAFAAEEVAVRTAYWVDGWEETELAGSKW